jgi:hypothetical protein
VSKLLHEIERVYVISRQVYRHCADFFKSAVSGCGGRRPEEAVQVEVDVPVLDNVDKRCSIIVMSCSQSEWLR